MLCDVYRIRSNGQKREREAIRKSPNRGELRFDSRPWDPRPSRQMMKAALLAADGERYVVPVLDQARLVRINAEGILITGVEVIPRGAGIKNIKADYYPQTWWCIPVPTQPLPLADDLSEWRSAASKDWAERMTGLAQAKQSDLT